MKKKIDLFWYWFIFVVAFVLCFFVVNDKKVNAYELDSNGNLVSDNLYTNNDYSFDLKSGRLAWHYVSLSSVDFEIGQTYTIKSFNERLGNMTCDVQNMGYPMFCNGHKYTFTYNGTKPSLRWGNDNLNISVTDYKINLIIVKGDVNPLEFIPFAVWYSQSNYDVAIDDAYQSGYDDGYDDGYVDSNSIPTIYLKDAIVYYYVTNIINGGESTMFQDVTSSISNLNGTLNFNSFINLNWGNLVRDNQTFNLDINLITPIGVDDLLHFSFNDIANSSEFLSKFRITFGDITSCGTDLVNCHSIVTLNYEDISNADFEVVLSNFDSSLSVTEFTHISINFYRENGFMYGITELIDTSLLSDVDTNYDIGYKVGYINGNSAGLVEGEKIGYDKGYSLGYRTASQIVSDPGNNTLVGLVSVVMGMPVNMLISIYNFEFLGINLASFILSLVSCIVIIWLIKKFL